MEINYQNNINDYYSVFMLYYFKQFLKFTKYFIVFYIFSILYVFIKHDEVPVYLLVIYLISLLYVFTVKFVVPIVKSTQYIKKIFKSLKTGILNEKFKVLENGFELSWSNIDYTFYFKQNEIQKIFSNKKYFVVVINSNEFIILNKLKVNNHNNLNSIILEIENSFSSSSAKCSNKS